MFSLCDSHERCFCVWAREHACVCARSEQRVTVFRKPLYLYVAHHGKFWNMYGSARGVVVIIVVNHFNYFHLCLAAAVFQVQQQQQQQQPSKRLGCHGTTAAYQVFSFCDSHEWCFSVWVRERSYMCAKSEQRHIHYCLQT